MFLEKRTPQKLGKKKERLSKGREKEMMEIEKIKATIRRRS